MKHGAAWTVVGLAGAMVLAGCGGGDDLDDDRFVPLEVGTRAFVLSGTEDFLPLTNADTVLAASLAALVAGANLAGSEYVDFELEGGSGSVDCDAGSIDQLSASAPGVADFTLQADQCYFDIAQDDEEVVLDGQLDVFATTGSGGDGDVSFGSGATSFVGAFRGPGQDAFAFAQIRGDVSFDTDATTDFSSTFNASLIIGSAVPDANDRVVPTRYFEVATGVSATAFEIDSEVDASRLSVFGPLALRGVGLSSACDVRGRVTVNTNDAVSISEGIDGLRFSNGQMTVSTSAGNALVTFDASGGATVQRPTGPPVNYTAAQVESICGFDF